MQNQLPAARHRVRWDCQYIQRRNTDRARAASRYFMLKSPAWSSRTLAAAALAIHVSAAIFDFEPDLKYHQRIFEIEIRDHKALQILTRHDVSASTGMKQRF
jgi:hypothetical protein